MKVFFSGFRVHISNGLCVCTAVVYSIYMLELCSDHRLFSNIRIPEDHHSNNSIAHRLNASVRILCWVMTQPQNHESRGRAVLATWGPRCDRVLFMSTAADPVLNTIVLPVAEGRENLWYKVQAAFLYIYAHHRHEYDWVLKADDDTYVVVENLRRMLYDYRPHDLWYFGCRFRAHNGVEFMSGGAGYVLSRAATIVLAERGITGGECTESAGGVDDYAMGICLKKLNVTFGKSVDRIGHQRFLPFAPEMHLRPNFASEDNWYWDYRMDGSREYRVDNCSQHVISFHYITPDQMRTMDYLLYTVSVFGRIHNTRDLVEAI